MRHSRPNLFKEPLAALQELTKQHTWKEVGEALPWIFVFTGITFALHSTGFFRSFESDAYDLLVRMNPMEPEHTFLVEIKDKDYADLFQSKSPLDCDALQQLLKQVAMGRPKMIVVDIDTADPQFKNLDQNVLGGVPTIWAEDAAAVDALIPYEVQSVFEEERPIVVKPKGVLGGREIVNKALALMLPDHDGVVRSYLTTVPVLQANTDTTKSVKEPTPPGDLPQRDTLPWAVAKTQPKVEPERNGEKILFDYSFDPAKYHAYSAIDVEKIADGGSGWHDIVKDKIVIVGCNYSAARDFYATPRGMVPGMKILALAIESQLQHKGKHEPTRSTFVIADICCGIVFTLAACLLTHTNLFWLLLACPVIGLIFSCFIFSRVSTWICFIPVMFGVYLHFILEHLKVDREMLAELNDLKARLASSGLPADDTDRHLKDPPESSAGEGKEP